MAFVKVEDEKLSPATAHEKSRRREEVRAGSQVAGGAMSSKPDLKVSSDVLETLRSP
jgi:hypothetical protein